MRTGGGQGKVAEDMWDGVCSVVSLGAAVLHLSVEWVPGCLQCELAI